MRTFSFYARVNREKKTHFLRQLERHSPVPHKPHISSDIYNSAGYCLTKSYALFMEESYLILSSKEIANSRTLILWGFRWRTTVIAGGLLWSCRSRLWTRSPHWAPSPPGIPASTSPPASQVSTHNNKFNLISFIFNTRILLRIQCCPCCHFLLPFLFSSLSFILSLSVLCLPDPFCLFLSFVSRLFHSSLHP